jgi:predicted membrane protein
LCLFKLKTSVFKVFAGAVSLMLLLQVLLMRWTVVIGGQLMSKSTRGYTQFHPEWFDKEGILTVIVLVSLPFIVLFIMSKIFPLWLEEEKNSS